MWIYFYISYAQSSLCKKFYFKLKITKHSGRLLTAWAVKTRRYLVVNGGGGEIRTPGELSPTTVFKTVPFNHSGTPPNIKSPKDCSFILLQKQGTKK